MPVAARTIATRINAWARPMRANTSLAQNVRERALLLTRAAACATPAPG
ncbi:MAG TPA: hypothetical protein VMF70_11090 [Gemmatimonadales bacterium]|nr:hypothetical protein [Gemmatimonadales bacterium]